MIGPDGKVEQARVLRSQPLLDEAALAAVRGWEYTRTLLNGRPTAVIMTVTVQFTLTPFLMWGSSPLSQICFSRFVGSPWLFAD